MDWRRRVVSLSERERDSDLVREDRRRFRNGGRVSDVRL